MEESFRGRKRSGKTGARHFGPTILRRFILTFFLLVVVPTLTILFFISRAVLSSMYETSLAQARETGAQILLTLTNEAEVVSYQAAALMNDPDLQGNVARYTQETAGSGRTVAATNIDRNLINFFDFTNKAGTISLLTHGAGWYSYGNLPNPGALPSQVGSLVYDAEQNRGRVVFSDQISNNTFTVAIASGIGELDSDLKVLLLRIRAPFLDDLSKPEQDLNRTHVVLLGRSNEVLLTTLDSGTLDALRQTTRSANGQTDTSLRLAGHIWLVSRHQVDVTGWTLLTLRNEASLTAQFQGYERGLFGALLLLGILFFGYMALFFSRIATPIRHVVRSMDLVGEGSWGISISQPDLKELNGLVESFNRMSGEIVRLNNERIAVEIDALRHQINPHFIANTLNVIKLMASTAHLRNIEQMTADLMVLLSDSYSGGSSLTELTSELRNIESYVRIMKMRFDTGFDLKLEISQDVEGAQVLRMLLQPLVENSILHGFSGLQRRGKIVIRCRIETGSGREFSPFPQWEPELSVVPNQSLVLEVEDNGKGMDPARANVPRGDPLQTKDRLARIGLDNVVRRIGLHFGQSASLVVKSSWGEMTRVRIELPLLRRSTHA